MLKRGIFISYSHEDTDWLDKLQVALKPLAKSEEIDLWSDKDIRAGSNWAEEIDKAIDRARIAILLVSPNFLASDYIMDKELPRILKNTQDGKTIVYWIAISPSLYEVTPLRDIQSANNPSEPLSSLAPYEQDQELVKIAKKIRDAIEVNAISNVMHIIDEFVPGQRAFLDDSPLDSRPRSFGVQAIQSGDEVHFKSGDDTVVEVITVKDMENLDDGSRQLIRSYERAMEDLFDRWTELQPRSVARDELVKEKARNEMSEVRGDLCNKLNTILNFLESMGKHLHDHYLHVRFICSQPEA